MFCSVARGGELELTSSGQAGGKVFISNGDIQVNGLNGSMISRSSSKGHCKAVRNISRNMRHN
jgi:hypothetical protein